MSNDLFNRLKASNRLPSPPGVALRILELARSDDTSLDDLAKTISSDPALAGRILKFVNSPSSGIGRQIATMDEAVNQIGLRGVQLMALSFSLVSSGKVEACPSFEFEAFWSRSLACGVAAKIFATTAGRMDPNEAFIMGLLLHIGQLAMACGAPDEYEQVLHAASTNPQDLRAIEEEKMGMAHIMASARLLEDWKLPESIWQTITKLQEAESLESESDGITPVRVLYIADVTATLLCDSKEQRSGKVTEILDLVKQSFEIDEAGWAELYDQIVLEWRAYGQLLSVKAGTDKSFRDLQDEARDQITMLSLATQLENRGIKEQNEELLQRTRTDALTGIANRASFDESLEAELERAHREHRPLILCMVDIDHFKKFNDTHGHQVGDEVLQAVAEALDGTARKMDVVARYGGEEFAVIAPGCSLGMAPSLGERLRMAVEEVCIKAGEEQLRVTISVGLAFAQWPGHSKTPAELVRAADEMLYAAKAAGRNCCQFEAGLREAA